MVKEYSVPGPQELILEGERFWIHLRMLGGLQTVGKIKLFIMHLGASVCWRSTQNQGRFCISLREAEFA